MTLTKFEYMILNAAKSEPIIMLTQIVRHFCMPWFPRHNLTNAQLIGLLLALQDRNFIVAHASDLKMNPDIHYDKLYPSVPAHVLLKGEEFDLESWPVVLLTPQIIDEELNIGREFGEYEKQHRCQPKDYSLFKNKFSYHLTPEGGVAWEETAQVDWSKYYTWSLRSWESADLAPGQTRHYGRAGATTLETLEAYFDWRLRWDNNTEPEKTLKSFTRWHAERVVPWKPLYWKTLTEGYECDFAEYTVKYPDDKTVQTRSSCRNVMYNMCWKEHAEMFQWYTTPWKPL